MMSLSSSVSSSPAEIDTLYISDLDGTLLGSDSLVSAESRRLLNEAISAGAAFTVATARTPATVAPLLAGVDMRLPAVVMTGAALWNPSTGLYSDVRHIDPETVDALLRIYEQEGLPTFVYILSDSDTRSHIDIRHLGPFSPQEREFMEMREGSPYKSFHILPGAGESVATLPTSDVILLFAMQEEEPVSRVAQRIERAHLPCVALHYHDTYGPESELMEVFGPGATKGEAISRLRRLTGARRVVVFGDNVNDLPMMREADVAVAVEGAVEEVKAQADIVIGPNVSDSVARFIHRDFFRHSSE